MTTRRRLSILFALPLALGLTSGAAVAAAPAADASRSVVHSSWWNGPRAYGDCVRSSNNFVNQNGWRIYRACYQVKSTNQFPTYVVEFVK